MDAAAIKAYSSVIADAAEDSEPQTPVIYHQVAQLDDEAKPKKAASDVYNPDPMGSMIQNEISSIKDASVKAAKDREDWAVKDAGLWSVLFPPCRLTKLKWSKSKRKESGFDLDKGKLYWHI